MNDHDLGDRPRHRGRKFRGKRLKTTLPRPEHAEPLPVPKSAERIAKVMARAGVASRREAEAMIAAGRVAVNGATIASPALNVAPADRITIDGVPLPRRERTRLFLFHKPRGLVTTSADPQGRPTIFGALPKDLPRLISVGRLDLNTEGLLLLTNDGGLARALELPATGWLRRYRVRAHGRIAQAKLDTLRHGIEVDGIRYGAIEATLEREQGSNVWLSFAMREGKNREIRNVLRALGLQVNRLIRISYGPFQLADLPAGAVQEVPTRILRDQLGERLAAQAGADFSAPIMEREPVRTDHEMTPFPPRSGGEGRPPKAATPPHSPGSNRGARGEWRRAPHRSNAGERPFPAGEASNEPSPRRGDRRDKPRHRPHRPHRGRHSGPQPSRPKAR